MTGRSGATGARRQDARTWPGRAKVLGRPSLAPWRPGKANEHLGRDRARLLVEIEEISPDRSGTRRAPRGIFARPGGVSAFPDSIVVRLPHRDRYALPNREGRARLTAQALRRHRQHEPADDAVDQPGSLRRRRTRRWHEPVLKSAQRVISHRDIAVPFRRQGPSLPVVDEPVRWMVSGLRRGLPIRDGVGDRGAGHEQAQGEAALEERVSGCRRKNPGRGAAGPRSGARASGLSLCCR